MGMERGGGKGDEGGVCLQIVQARRKPPENYRRRYCHKDMHEKNYHIVASLRVKRELAVALECGETWAVNEIAKMARDEGIEGVFTVRKNPGGPGRPGRWESSADYCTKKQAHCPKKIGTFRAAGDDEEGDMILCEVDEEPEEYEGDD